MLGTIQLTVPVIGQAILDNGLVNFNSGGIGSNLLPPDASQQGVVTTSQPFGVLKQGSGLYNPDNNTFSGNYLFGLSGGASQYCTHTTNDAVSLTASAPGRFEVLFNGTTQPCSPGLAFPASPTTLAVYSVDALNSPASAKRGDRLRGQRQQWHKRSSSVEYPEPAERDRVPTQRGQQHRRQFEIPIQCRRNRMQRDRVHCAASVWTQHRPGTPRLCLQRHSWRRPGLGHGHPDNKRP